MADENADFVTISRAMPGSDKWLVAVMRYERSSDSHIMRECSAEASYHAAVHLASQWSKDKGLDVRYIGKQRGKANG